MACVTIALLGVVFYLILFARVLMPLYEYECPKCGVFDAIQSFSEKPLKARPDCPEKDCPKKAQRLISAAAFHLKGGGWYKDGYASTPSSDSKGTSTGKNATSTSSGASESSASESSAPSKSEKPSGDSAATKPATKSPES